jgi:competence protein ComEC
MCGVVAGAALQLQQSALLSLWVYVVTAVAAALAWCWLWMQPAWRSRCMYLCLGVALAWGVTGWRAAVFQAGALPAAWEEHDVRVTGVIADMPQTVERGVRLRFRVENAQLPDAAPARAKDRPGQPMLIALNWYGPLPEPGLRAGQRWQWTVRLKAPRGEKNPHSMDWELWLWSQNIRATGYVRQGGSDEKPLWLAQTTAAPVAQWRGYLHQSMQAPPDASARMQASLGVVQALVTGAQSSIERSDWQLFRDTGVAHLVSISGLHITMFAWLAMAVVNVLWRRSARLCLWWPAPLAAAWAGLGLAAAYAVFSGWGIPAQRTIGMLCVVVWLRSQGRVWPWPYVWLVVLTVVVGLDPWSLLQAGFWLSFVAVGVLFAAQPPERNARARRWWHAGAALVREQWVVGLALAPLTLLLFGQISAVGMLANLWAIPWVTLVITPLSMLGAFWSPMWSAAAYCVTGMVWLLEGMAAWPVAVLYFAQPPWWAGLAGIVACLWMVLPWGWRWRVLALPLVVPMWAWVPALPAQGQFDVLALDVGQGSAVLLRTQHHSLLFDAGPKWSAQSDAGERVVVPVLRALGVEPTAMVVSHADNDHAGGAISVQQAFARMQWWGAGGKPCLQGQFWQWDGVRFEMLHPRLATHSATLASSNASSCVLKVSSADGFSALLTGDIEAAQEQALLAAGVGLKAQLVLVPHHGSKTSSSADFVNAVQPQFAIVQSGYRNRFGHPAARVVQRYQAAGAQLVNTPACGAALWRSWMPDSVQCERAMRRRYWSGVLPSD